MTDETPCAVHTEDTALQDLKARIRELPLPEKLRLAADMLEAPGVAIQMPLAVARLALSELEVSRG